MAHTEAHSQKYSQLAPQRPISSLTRIPSSIVNHHFLGSAWRTNERSAHLWHPLDCAHHCPSRNQVESTQSVVSVGDALAPGSGRLSPAPLATRQESPQPSLQSSALSKKGCKCSVLMCDALPDVPSNFGEIHLSQPRTV